MKLAGGDVGLEHAELFPGHRPGISGIDPPVAPCKHRLVIDECFRHLSVHHQLATERLLDERELCIRPEDGKAGLGDHPGDHGVGGCTGEVVSHHLIALIPGVLRLADPVLGERHDIGVVKVDPRIVSFLQEMLERCVHPVALSRTLVPQPLLQDQANLLAALFFDLRDSRLYPLVALVLLVADAEHCPHPRVSGRLTDVLRKDLVVL